MATYVVLTSGTGWHVEDLNRAAGTLGKVLIPIPFDQITARLGGGRGSRVGAGGFNLTGADGVLVRMMPPGSLEQVVFRMDVLHELAASGVPVLNPPRAVEIAVDKYLSLALLDRAGLPVPETWVAQRVAEALDAFDRLGGQAVVKPLFGSEGRGLIYLDDRETAWRAFHALERLSAVLYLQRPVRHPGFDTRVFVLRGEVLGAMRRRPAAGDWRTNVSQGGHAESCRLEPDLARLAVSAARATAAEMAGVDLIHDLDRDTPVVLEVNAVPGWRALARVTGIDIAAAILQAIESSPHAPGGTR